MTDAEFCTFYETHVRRLWAYVVRATGDASAADGIVQEAFIRVYGAESAATADGDQQKRYIQNGDQSDQAARVENA